jgi:C-terminal processing protease CtpA/Prc
MIGDKCFVVGVRPKSDAEAKGLKSGDEVLAFNGYAPTRDDLWKMEFVYRYLRPQPELRFEARSPDGKERTVNVAPRVQVTSRVIDVETDFWKVVNEEENLEHLYRLQSATVDDLMIMKMPTFEFTGSQILDIMDKARSYKSLIIDLRADGGGSTETLKSLVGAVLDHDVKIADRIARGKPIPFVAKSRGKNAFTGKLIVLVDSQPASASELFARMVQLEKRGIVVGDRSSGSVMEASRYGYEAGTGGVVFFGAQITDADLVMADGKSLERVGVIPDETLVPLPADLATNRDPVLARAAELAGVKLTPEKAGELFPFEWEKF